MTGPALQRVLDALRDAGKNIRGSGDQYTAQCPSHPDNRASLSVGNGAGKVILNCQVGCTAEQVVTDLGLTWPETFDDHYTPKNGHKPRTQWVACYDYTAADGTLLFQKLRKHPKDFVIRRPNGSGGWVYGIGNAPRVLYRLPEVVAAVRDNAVIYIVEGEKDATRLGQLGLVATCNFDGAGKNGDKWRDIYSDVLAGARVVIIADNDEPGYAHAKAAAASLAHKAAAVRVVRPAVATAHADVSDHLDAGYTVDDLVEYDPDTDPAADAEINALYPVLDWATVWTNTPELCDWLVEPLFERGRIYAVYAPAKAGKSLLLQEVAAGLATGKSVLGNAPQPACNVLYVDLENSVADIVERMAAYGYGPADLGRLKYLSFPSLPALDSKRGGAHLLAVATHHKVQLVIIDTVSRVIDGSENDSDTFHALYRHALGPLKAAGITTVRLDHEGKDMAKGQRGSSAKATDADTVWRLEAPRSTSRVLVRMASRTTHHPTQVTLDMHFSPLRHERGADADARPARDTTLGVTDVVAELGRLQVPTTWGRVRVSKLLAGEGLRIGNEVLAEAVKTYKDQFRGSDAAPF